MTNKFLLIFSFLCFFICFTFFYFWNAIFVRVPVDSWPPKWAVQCKTGHISHPFIVSPLQRWLLSLAPLGGPVHPALLASIGIAVYTFAYAILWHATSHPGTVQIALVASFASRWHSSPRASHISACIYLCLAVVKADPLSNVQKYTTYLYAN